MSYLVDTDRIVDGLRGRPEALALFERHKDDGLGVSVISLGEIYEGVEGHTQPEAHVASVQKFLRTFTVIPLSGDTMRYFGSLRARLRQQGNLIPDFDLLIAATAIEHHLVLITRNRRHFERISELQIYP